MSAYADSGYYGCAFTGFQDTLLSNVGYQLYSKCLIQGATDFIFGQQASAWFEKCDIRVLAASQGWVTGEFQLARQEVFQKLTSPTANGRDSSSNPSYYVFNSCNIAAASGNSVPNGAYYLGRPWGQYARVVFQKTSMSAVINSAGWSVWKHWRHTNCQHCLWRVPELGHWGFRLSSILQEPVVSRINLYHFDQQLCQQGLLRRLVHVVADLVRHSVLVFLF